MDEVFDVAAVRAGLEARLRALEAELHQVRAEAGGRGGAEGGRPVSGCRPWQCAADVPLANGSRPKCASGGR